MRNPKTKATYNVYQLRLENSTTPFYIGKGKNGRHKEHFCPYNLSDKSHKSNTILKAHESGIRVLWEIIHENLTESQAFFVERLYISILGRRDKGTGILTNRTDGGEGASGATRDKETLKRGAVLRVARYHAKSDIEKSLMKKKMSMARFALNLSPWEHPLAKLAIWQNANLLYAEFLKGANTKHKLAKIFCEHPNRLRTIANMFQSGWVPTQDNRWVERFN